jgi:hypothetical protein
MARVARATACDITKGEYNMKHELWGNIVLHTYNEKFFINIFQAS